MVWLQEEEVMSLGPEVHIKFLNVYDLILYWDFQAIILKFNADCFCYINVNTEIFYGYVGPRLQVRTWHTDIPSSK